MILRLEGFRCPDCGSDDLLIGSCPLQCYTCGWYHLNEYPCRICGGKSESSVYDGKVTLYGCKDHPISRGELNQVFRRFYRGLKAAEHKMASS